MRDSRKTHKEVKDLAIVRDGFWCVVSGNYDQDTFSKVSASIDEIGEASTYLSEDSSNEEVRSRLFSTPSMIGLSFSARFSVGRFEVFRLCHRATQQHQHTLPSNIMTIQSDVHEWFTRLETWFEKMTTTQSNHLSLPPEITFTTPDNEDLPVLSEPARYLCQGRPVFRGIDKQNRAVEDLGILAEDGSSAEVLSSALLKSMNQPRPPSSSPSPSSFPTRPDVPLFRPHTHTLRPPTRLLKCSNRPSCHSSS
ncbi:hypothetical protein ARMSODRAFT_1028327 [Armillaria solidipes]|uniref:Uncharacterized protein n=1 Tax=Armillaria solidipes TaxID=1076256 RepID=A0A2H3ATV1_9AGAR|nr:hypothetical protein ARMSODRAFT_1028327 [Armillaria solidipes]